MNPGIPELLKPGIAGGGGEGAEPLKPGIGDGVELPNEGRGGGGYGCGGPGDATPGGGGGRGGGISADRG